MNESQLHLTHRPAYLQGRKQGHRDAVTGQDYRPQDGATGTKTERQAYSLGYMDGWAQS